MPEVKISFFYQLLGNTPALPDNMNVKWMCRLYTFSFWSERSHVERLE